MKKMKMEQEGKKMMGLENEPGEGMEHEKAEGPAYEKVEDVAEGESEDSGEEEMGMGGDYKAECDANDLMRAAEIKNDPARMKKAMAILQKKKAAIESVADLKAARNAAFTKES